MIENRVFLCHSTVDKTFVERLAFDLEKVRVGVWFDKWEIRVGDSLLEKIACGIESHDYLAIILSPSSTESEWVKREVNAALMRELDEKKVVVLPILLTDCKIPILLKEKKYADFRTSYDEGFADLLFTVSPENPLTIQRSKDFRTAQYLICGLTSTDKLGTNTLNATQLREIYPYRRALQSFMDMEEKRLLFWSAVAHQHANPQKPHFLDISTPVWGLIGSVSPKQYANWIIDGLQGVLFEYLIPFYSWAKGMAEYSIIDQLKDAFICRLEHNDDFFSAREPMPPHCVRAALNSLAEDDRRIFDEEFLPRFSGESPYAPFIIEATAHLSPPLNDEFYFKFVGAESRLALAALKALSELRRRTAVVFLKEYISKLGDNNLNNLDNAFCDLSYSESVPELRSWLQEETSVQIRTLILVALTNAKASDQDSIIETVKMAINKKSDSYVLTMLARICGQNIIDPDNQLKDWCKEWERKPILAESAIFAFCRVYGSRAIDFIDSLLDIKCETVLAAVIESMAKVAKIDSYEKLKAFSGHNSILVQSAFYNGLRHIRPSNWEQYIPISQKQHPLVCLCAARTFAKIASNEALHQWLDDDQLNEIFRVTADEVLFSPYPFRPHWILNNNKFNSDLARLPVRLMSLDTEQIWLDNNYDKNRTLYILLKQR